MTKTRNELVIWGAVIGICVVTVSVLISTRKWSNTVKGTGSDEEVFIEEAPEKDATKPGIDAPNMPGNVTNANSVPEGRELAHQDRDPDVILQLGQEFSHIELNDKWLYENELAGILRLDSIDKIREYQEEKLRLLPPAIGIDLFSCEGTWMLAAYRDIMDSGYSVDQDKLQAMLRVAKADFEMILERAPENLSVLRGCAAYYSETGQIDDAKRYLELAIKYADAQGSFYDGIKARMALARLLRQENDPAAGPLYDKILEYALTEDVRNAIKEERSSAVVPRQGIHLFDISGLTFHSFRVGAITRLTSDGRQVFLDALAKETARPLNPSWLKVMPVVQDPKLLTRNLVTSVGFARDTYARLYHSAMFMEATSRRSAVAAVAQSLQETDQHREAIEYFHQAIEEAEKMHPGDSARAELLGYIYFRLGFSELMNQQREQAVKSWTQAVATTTDADVVRLCKMLIEKFNKQE